ncbi:CDP-glycerol glycerophosphotransferase family protein [Citrobacter braakii]|uniref:CDP-glycerol glycerophosphotransferase family protein n=1 Tax=Citrobacter braakii TaxID=57706 RepID=UPI001905A82F|nr:CDP-glycerol glycerophosphotransferase family protein [Citrobacter braakii]MBJ8993880.1 CDP-glycerol glycerophosphotransferase family protein [Citrobacter braakii]
MKYIRIILELITLMVLLPFNRLISKKYYIFYSPLGYVGNVRYVFEYFEKKGECVLFITNDHLKKSYFSTLLKLIQGRYIFLTHGVGRLPFLFFLNQRVQLWHGLPIKKILLDYRGDYQKSKYCFINVLLKKILKARINLFYNYLVTSDSELGKHLSQSMALPSQRVLKLGTPSIAKSYEYYALNKGNPAGTSSVYKVLYMPTWRDGSSTVSAIIDSFISEHAFFKENNIEIFCKLHPLDIKYNKTKEIPVNGNIYLLEQSEDIVKLLSGFDCLITDYSSVCFEFFPQQKPCIFYVPDLIDYFNKREAYINVEHFYSGQPRDIQMLKNTLLESRNGRCKNIDYKFYCGDNTSALENIYNKFAICKL